MPRGTELPSSAMHKMLPPPPALGLCPHVRRPARPPAVVVDRQWGLGELVDLAPPGNSLMPEAVCRDCQSLSIIWGRYS